jgi:hypothetical protein
MFDARVGKLLKIIEGVYQDAKAENEMQQQEICGAGERICT